MVIPSNGVQQLWNIFETFWTGLLHITPAMLKVIKSALVGDGKILFHNIISYGLLQWLYNVHGCPKKSGNVFEKYEIGLHFVYT